MIDLSIETSDFSILPRKILFFDINFAGFTSPFAPGGGGANNFRPPLHCVRIFKRKVYVSICRQGKVKQVKLFYSDGGVALFFFNTLSNSRTGSSRYHLKMKCHTNGQLARRRRKSFGYFLLHIIHKVQNTTLKRFARYFISLCTPPPPLPPN